MGKERAVGRKRSFQMTLVKSAWLVTAVGSKLPD